ncbi:MAG: glycosyltransferase [Paracoccaceae bacterium]
MPATPLRHLPAPVGADLARDIAVGPDATVAALAARGARADSLPAVLISQGLARQEAVYAALSRRSGLPLADPLLRSTPADALLIDRLGAEFCLRERLVPVCDAGGAVLVAATQPDALERHASRLAATFGKVVPALITPQALDAAIGRVRGAQLARKAEASVDERESCRSWGRTARVPRAMLLALLVAALAFWAPGALMAALTAWLVLSLALSMGLRLAAVLAALRPALAEPPAPIIARIPTVSIIVALYRESRIAPRLVRRLGRLDWPREHLDLILAVEEDDIATRLALEQAGLPGWMRIVTVPAGQPRTKPRALNYALSHCRGSIIGVYDAEDAPEPDQIARVVERFHSRGAQVACLQGRLDYYNPRTNWLSRCFTIEYAAWFRIILPGIARLGIPVPLGGTTLFFRRAALEDLGGWDAHNVTEDADLGIRLWRHGYRTELIDTVTGEEANCRALPWIKQRSRWIKGYMMTWLTHMRDPLRLWRELGPQGFMGFQILFLGSLTQALFAPVLWSFWAFALGLPHPLAGMLAPGLLAGMTGLFIASELLNIAIGIAGLRRTRHRLPLLWVPTLHLYHPLGTFAAWKAAWEMVMRPFWWDKTAHGVFDAKDRG